MVTSDSPDSEIISAAGGLPPEVRSGAARSARDVRGAGFRWIPLRLGASASAPDSLDPAGLRRVCELLDSTHPIRVFEGIGESKGIDRPSRRGSMALGEVAV